MTHDPSHDDAGLFPRKIAEGIIWFGNCLRVDMGEEILHSHLNVYLLKGREKTLLVDTGMPRHWSQMQLQLKKALDGRGLDFLMPTHPEAPHCSNIPYILEAYPQCQLVGDVRDYALYYPEYAARMLSVEERQRIELGDMSLEIVPAVLRDLPSSVWAYEHSRKVLFVADGFCFLHAGSQDPSSDEPFHRPGECTLTSQELMSGVDPARSEFFIRAALYWSRYVDPNVLFEEVASLMEQYPPDIIASAHGSVIVNVPDVLPLIKQTHQTAYMRARNNQSLVADPSRQASVGR